MAIDIVDVLALAHEERTRKVIMSTRKMHAWMHYFPTPGEGTDLHCHPGDQTFMVLEGECTMHFDDGGKTVMGPGAVALIEGGSFYQVMNSGTGPMVMMGTRTGPRENNTHINHETREHMRAPKRPRGEKVEYAGIPSLRK
jgi:mannose-6-phosphate isomerase-like protein (cupin superfamily)